MTITLERPVSPVCDSELANDIRHLVDNLDTNIYDIVKDYQEIFCCEVILIDDNKNHCEIEIHLSLIHISEPTRRYASRMPSSA